MSPIETITIVTAVYAVVFLAHRASQLVEASSDESSKEPARRVEEVAQSQVA